MLLSLLAIGCSGGEGGGPTAPRLALEACHVPGLDAESRCGTYEVFEDRSSRTGRKIALRVLVVPAVSPEPRPDPLFFLAGGPGQAATEVAGGIWPAFERIHKHRDVVFIDQRGTGSSHPLDCPLARDSLAELLTLDPIAETLRCRETLAQDADLALYTTPVAMEDLDEVRQALGYDRINLYGASYGTRAALVYMRQHPRSVRAAILDGVAPTTMVLGLDFARDGQAALDALLAGCAAEDACNEAFPDLAGTLSGLLADLETPREVQIIHPRTGEVQPLTVDRELLSTGIQSQLYAPPLAALLPLALTEAAAGDFSPFIAQTLGFTEGLSEGISDGMKMSILCAEDADRLPADLAAPTAGTFLRDTAVRDIPAICREWPKGALPPGYHDPVSSDAPALLLSGALDPVTPPRWAEEAAKTLPNARALVAPGAGHNVAASGCVPRLMEEFLEAGSAADLDASCVEKIRRPPFFIDFAGPAQ